MDVESVISVSSSSTDSTNGGTSDSLTSVLSVSSESECDVVSWDSHGKVKRKILNCEEISNHSQKVRDWMKSCKYDEIKGAYVSKATKDNQSTCIRYDFDKSVQTPRTPQSCFTRSTPLFSYMEEAKKEACLKNVSKAKATDKEQSCIGSNVHKKNGNIDIPLSPESKKKELCSYLQLMKPGNKKEECLVEQRRSSRVKNMNQTKLRERSPQFFSEFSENAQVVDHEMINTALKELEELNMKIYKLKGYVQLNGKDNDKNVCNTFLPLPSEKIYTEQVDFEESIKEIVKEVKQTKNNANRTSHKIGKKKKFNFDITLKKKLRNISSRRAPSLRSKGHLKNVSLDMLVLRKNLFRKNVRRQLLRTLKQKPEEEKVKESPQCEIISVQPNSDDENVDLRNFVDDMLELDKMSEEHRKSVIESRILASSSIANLMNKRTSQAENVQRAFKIFSELSNERKTCLEETEEKENTHQETIRNIVASEHDYASTNTRTEDEENDQESCSSLSPIPTSNVEVLPVNKFTEIKSLHRSLAVNLRRKRHSNNNSLHNWTSSCKSDTNNLKHSISISKMNGKVLKAFYQDYNLVIIQESSVSFWTQSALGDVLGAQNMWIPKGQAQRIPLNNMYCQKDALDMMISTETSVAYVELWTKEHKSEMREVPVTDVFATVYFWRLRQSGLDKKALQLENIKGVSDEVQYCVLRCYPKIIVSWHSVEDKKTTIHSYHLAADFQTVANISEIQPVEHYVESLHNIEDCDNLIMGAGENKITLWNIEYGYVVATIDLASIKSPLSTLWVKCDRGFLFMIQECEDQELQLIAINGMNHSWKKLQNYVPLQDFGRVKGVYIENGILVACYRQGILCWNAQIGEIIMEETLSDCEYIPSRKHVIVLANEKVIVKYLLNHLITAGDL